MGNILHIQNGAKICLPQPGGKADTIRYVSNVVASTAGGKAAISLCIFCFLVVKITSFFFCKCVPLRVAGFRFDEAIIA